MDDIPGWGDCILNGPNAGARAAKPDECLLLSGGQLFRPGEKIYINRSDELTRYRAVIHTHDFIEIAYVAQGAGLHSVNGRTYKTSAGDLFVINFNVPHGFFPLREGGAHPEVYNCIFMPEFLDLSLFSAESFEEITSSFLFKSLFGQESLPLPDLKLRGEEKRRIQALFLRMHGEYRERRIGYSDLLRAYLIELIVAIFRCKEEQLRAEPAPQAQPHGADSPAQAKNRELIENAVDYMKEHYDSRITLSSLAMHSFISKNYFSRLFRETTGIPFSDYIQQLRVAQACRLLRQTSRTVADIADGVGFGDLKFFYEVFKKITGTTPGDYRKERR